MADHKLLKLSVAKVNEPVFDGEVVSVHVPGVDGDMEIFADHTALISPLKKGVVTIKKENGENEKHEINSGTLEISNNHATILV